MATPQLPQPLVESYWSRDESMPLLERTVGSLLAERAEQHPERTALSGNQHGSGAQLRLTYRELHERACRVATALVRLADPWESVALLAPNVVEWPVVQYGAALAGMTLVALNPALTEADLEYALCHSGAAVLLHADRNRDDDLAARVASARQRCPALREVVSLTETDRWIADEPAVKLPGPNAGEPAMLHYTSGTTGDPKGVVLRHRSLVNVAKLTMEAVDAPEGAVAVNPLPMYHTAACVIGTLGPLWLGGTAVLIEKFDAADTLSTIAREAAEVLFFVPTVLGALLQAAQAREQPAPRLRTVMGGAAPVPRNMIEDAERVFGASVHTVYGQTELAPVLSATRRTDARDDQVSTVGRPLPQVDCKVVDPATGAVVPVGTSGEICARGYQQLTEYYHDPDATAATVDADGWVHTGDLGTMDARGMLTITGRLKEIIIRGGENIAPAEVESCLAEHADVAEAAVLGLPDDRLGEVVAAIVRPNGADDGSLRERLELHCRERLMTFKVPQRWFLAEALPVTPTGKVQKFKLRDAVADLALPPLSGGEPGA